MVFSSIPFLFFFLPFFFLLYFLVPFRLKNSILLIFSLIFYAWGEPIYIFLMIFTSLVDFLCSKMIGRYRSKQKKRLFLLISVIVDLGLLGFFKYSDFLITSVNSWFDLAIPLLKLGLPIGISFYTFQTMSYTIDVYRGEVKPEKNYFTYLTYLSMFPQLIAGPIVRYETVNQELHQRTHSYAAFSEGLLRFLRGLFKKVLIANQVGFLFTTISQMAGSELSVLTSWIGLIAFSFQIYFDFSGYSDMAIGMGKMMGFHFLENFNYPYIAKSITDFWRRWHISLSTWFRDYVYIPLGGSRVKKIINIRNIFLVWALTGIWHGAAWNFLLWGIYFGIVLILEKFVFHKWLEKLPSFWQHSYAILFILIGWMIFSADQLRDPSLFIQSLFGFRGVPFADATSFYYLKSYFVILLIAGIASTPFLSCLKKKLNPWMKKHSFLSFLGITFLYSGLLFVSMAYLVADTYNPFLYFRF